MGDLALACHRGHDISDPDTVYIWRGRAICGACRAVGWPPEDAIVDPQSKTCSKCKKIRPLSQFPRRKASRSGRDSWCRSCKATAQRRLTIQARRRSGQPQQDTEIDLDLLAAAITNPPKALPLRLPCSGQTGLFFPNGTTAAHAAQAERAKKLCQDCPACYPCLARALTIHTATSDTGIWGGTTPEERRTLRRQLKTRRQVVRA